MATLTVFEPQWKASAGSIGPGVQQGFPDLVNGLFRKGDFVGVVTTGTIASPSPSGAAATSAGPSLGANSPFNITTASTSITQGVVTVTATASAGTPALTYFCEVTYDSSGVSLPSQPFMINVPANLLPLVTVASTGAPAGTTTFTLFCSTTPNTFWQQGTANTAFASTTGPAYPLANHTGLNKLAANFTSACFGLADAQSDSIYYQGPGGSPNVGIRAPFGATQSYAPGWDNYALSVPVLKLRGGLVEINLVQAWQTGLLYGNIGFSIDAATGYFVASTSATTAGTIQDKAFGPDQGDVGDTYSRVLVRLNDSVLA